MIKFRWGSKAFLIEVCGICIQVFFRVTLRQPRDTNHTRRRGPHLLYNCALVPAWKDWKGSRLCYQGQPYRSKVIGRTKDLRKRRWVQFPVGVPKTISTISFGKMSVIFKSYMSLYYYIFNMTYYVLSHFYLGQSSGCSYSLILSSLSQIFWN